MPPQWHLTVNIIIIIIIHAFITRAHSVVVLNQRCIIFKCHQRHRLYWTSAVKPSCLSEKLILKHMHNNPGINYNMVWSDRRYNPRSMHQTQSELSTLLSRTTESFA